MMSDSVKASGNNSQLGIDEHVLREIITKMGTEIENV